MADTVDLQIAARAPIVKLWRKKKEDMIAWAKAQGACATADGAVVGPSQGRILPITVNDDSRQ